MNYFWCKGEKIVEISLKESDFLESFDLLWSKDLDKYKKNKLNLFVLKINSNEFDYDLLINRYAP